MRKTGIAALCTLIFLGSAWGLFTLSKARTFQLFGELVPRVETDEKAVALTFDDAPASHTDDVLAVLGEKDVHATFFVIGSLLEKDPAAGERIVTLGHELGNHSYTHERMVLKTLSFMREEVETTDALIRRAGFHGEIYFRPPFGKKLIGLPWYLSRTGRATVMWDVEPESFSEIAEDAGRIEEHVLANVRPGSIILLHGMCGEETCAETRKALPRIIDRLREEGYFFVTLSELLREY